MANEIGHAFIALIPSFSGSANAIKSQLTTAGVGRTIERELTGTATRAGTRAGGLFSRAFQRISANRANFPGPSASVLRNIRTYAFAISGAASLTVGFGLKTASSLEQARIAFATMLGSAKRAKTFVGGLVQFAKKTPFDFPGVVSASQKLLAFGFAARKIKPTLTSLGDAAAGLSLGTEGLDRLTTAIGQIQAKGKVQSDELLQLTEAGVPALRILSNEFGVSTKKLQKYVTKGLVPANKAIPALLQGLETGTRGAAGETAKFGGLMAKQSHTLGGIFSNLKDSLSLGLARAVRPLIPLLKDAMPAAGRSIGRAFTAAGKDLAEFLHGLGVAKDRSKGVSTGFEQFGSVLRSTFNAVRAVFGFISRNAKIFKPWVAQILGAVIALKAFRLVMVGVNLVMDANPVSLVVVAIGALIGAFIYAWKTSEKFRKVVGGVFHVLERTAGILTFTFVKAFQYIADAFLSFAGMIVHTASSAFGWIPGIGGKLKGAAKAFDAFKSHVDNTLSGIATDALNFGVETGQNFAGGVQAGYAAAAKYYVKGSGLGNLGKALGQQQKKSLGSAATGMGDAWKGALDGAGDKAKKSSQQFVDKILSPLKDLIAKARQLAQSVTQTILGETGFGALLNQTDAFGQTSFGTSVKSIIAGFVNQQRQVRRFRKELRLLDRKGLSAGAIEEIANLGVSQGGSLAETLLGGSRKQLRRISNLFGGTRSSARGIGNDVAGNRFGAQISHELVRTRNAIEKASKNTELGPKTMRKLAGGFNAKRNQSAVYLDGNKVGSALDVRGGHIVASLS